MASDKRDIFSEIMDGFKQLKKERLKKEKKKPDPLVETVHRKMDDAKERLESVVTKLREAREIAVLEPAKLRVKK